MKKLAVVILFLLVSCGPDAIWPYKWCCHRFHNQTNKSLKMYYIFKGIIDGQEFVVKKNDSLQIKLEPRNCGAIFYSRDTLMIEFEDGRKIPQVTGRKPEQINTENIFYTKNIVRGIPGKRFDRCESLTNYYIKPIHYEKAK